MSSWYFNPNAQQQPKASSYFGPTPGQGSYYINPKGPSESNVSNNPPGIGNGFVATENLSLCCDTQTNINSGTPQKPLVDGSYCAGNSIVEVTTGGYFNVSHQPTACDNTQGTSYFNKNNVPQTNYFLSSPSTQTQPQNHPVVPIQSEYCDGDTMSSSHATTPSLKRNLQFSSTERSRDRLRKRVEEEKKKESHSKKKDEEEKKKTIARKSVSPVKTMKSPRMSVGSATKKDEVVSNRGRKRKVSVDKNEETPKGQKRNTSPSKSASKSPSKAVKGVEKKGDKEKERWLAKPKGRRGRPVGWRKNMIGLGYMQFASGVKKVPQQQTIQQQARKIQKRIVDRIKKKYNREVTPCPDDETKGARKKAAKHKASPMKTRALQKKSEKEENSLVARCVLCRSRDGDLQSCAECTALYHLRKCCRYSEEAASLIESGGRKRWLCSRCSACARCNEYIADPSNVECRVCTVAYHGKCGEKAGKTIDGTFTCDGCIKLSKSNPKEKEVKKEDEKPKVEKTWKRGRKAKGWTYLIPNTEENNAVNEETRRIEERDALYNSITDQVTKGKNGTDNSPSKFGMIMSSPQKIKKIALQGDVDLFESAKQALALEKRTMKKEEAASTSLSSPSSSHSSLDIRHQWIYVGSKKDKMKSIYSSPYPQEIVESNNVYICPFCLRANNDQDMFRIHQKECTWNCPPGNEIYRDTEKKLSFFEVDGADQKLYCRRVCLLGKLFISSKTLVDEVETFLFYVLVEHTNEGCEFVGYFSKEKNPSKNNNLSCILTLPSAMRSGYGRLLIDLSYELSRVEKKIGSPEHPLSDLGLIAYMGFWRSSILCYLRSLRGSQIASVKQISLATRIAPQDVINQLLRDGLLFYRDGTYFVNTEQRAYRMPLAMTRRKTIDHSKLKWAPEEVTGEHLDPSKLNYYV